MQLSNNITNIYGQLFGCSEITFRLQTARTSVRQLLLRYLLPWLCNMELVDPNLPPLVNGFSYSAYYSDLGRSAANANGTAGQQNIPGTGLNLSVLRARVCVRVGCCVCIISV